MLQSSAKASISFYNVPKPHKFEAPPKDMLCQACEQVTELPLNVFTCNHQLCAPCWQRSAYNLYGYTNECMVCKKPTELVCYRDFWKFLAKNVFQDKCWPDHEKRDKLDKLKMHCSVEGCTFADERATVITHERDCWNQYRQKNMLKDAETKSDTELPKITPRKVARKT